jgi:hypothetical protein
MCHTRIISLPTELKQTSGDSTWLTQCNVRTNVVHGKIPKDLNIHWGKKNLRVFIMCLLYLQWKKFRSINVRTAEPNLRSSQWILKFCTAPCSKERRSSLYYGRSAVQFYLLSSLIPSHPPSATPENNGIWPQMKPRQLLRFPPKQISGNSTFIYPKSFSLHVVNCMWSDSLHTVLILYSFKRSCYSV